MKHWRSVVAKVSQHVEHGKSVVAEQRDKIERLRAVGASTEDAEKMLETFAKTLSALEVHRQYLLRSGDAT